MFYDGYIPVKLAYFVSHPIQYQAPLLRRIAQEPDIELTVFFSSDHSVQGYTDEGFGGVRIQWDVPLLDGYKHEFLPGFRNRNKKLGFATPLSYGIFSRLRRGNFDAVWVHGYHTLNALHTMIAARLLKIPVFIRTDSTLHNRPRSRAKLALKRIFFAFLRRMVRGVLTSGENNTEYWRISFSGKVPLFVMPYAVDNDYFRDRVAQAAPDRETFRGTLNLKPGLPVFLFASKLQRNKRCIDLVEAFLRLAPAPGIAPSAYLLIAGDGEERVSLDARIRESGASNIRMLGFRNQSELPRLFDLCDVFVLPAVFEAWGLVINEVMNAARTIVVSDQVGCVPDLLRDGVNGFVFPARNIEALSGILRRLVDDASLVSTTGKRAAETIASYSFEQDVEGLRRALAFARSRV
jgi:glycosyltransferase involved in cell wall biosynthesis